MRNHFVFPNLFLSNFLKVIQKTYDCIKTKAARNNDENKENNSFKFNFSNYRISNCWTENIQAEDEQNLGRNEDEDKR